MMRAWMQFSPPCSQPCSSFSNEGLSTISPGCAPSASAACMHARSSIPPWRGQAGGSRTRAAHGPERRSRGRAGSAGASRTAGSCRLCLRGCGVAAVSACPNCCLPMSTHAQPAKHRKHCRHALHAPPCEFMNVTRHSCTAPPSLQLQTEELDEATTSGDGTLRGAPASHRRGDTSLTIFIDKWGFKDAGGLVEPRVVVSVRDESGEKVEAVQVRRLCRDRWEGRPPGWWAVPCRPSVPPT